MGSRSFSVHAEYVNVNETRSSLGKRGEAAAEKYLKGRGLQLRGRNWRHGRVGEIDLIFEDDHHQVIFVEVKTRTSNESFEVVDQRKLNRLRRLAAAWLASQSVWFEYRIDIVTVIVSRRQTDGDWASATIHWWKGVDR